MYTIQYDFIMKLDGWLLEIIIYNCCVSISEKQRDDSIIFYETTYIL